MEARDSLRFNVVSHLNLKELPTFRLFPYSCQYCVYWESTGDFDEKIGKEEAQRLKSAWFRRVSREFGDCGVIAYLNDEPAGYAEYAPPKFLSRVQQYESGPPSSDAVFLACLYIPKKELRGRGIGKSLLDFVLSDLQKRGYTAIETFARIGSESSPAGPLEFYLKQGFSVKREKDEFPLVRKELARPDGTRHLRNILHHKIALKVDAFIDLLKHPLIFYGLLAFDLIFLVSGGTIYFLMARQFLNWALWMLITQSPVIVGIYRKLQHEESLARVMSEGYETSPEKWKQSMEEYEKIVGKRED